MARTRLLAIPLLLAPFYVGSRAADNPRSRWDPAAAGRFMEARQQMWLDFTARDAARNHKPEITACTSCHTSLPYLLGRPALAGVLGESAETPNVRTFLARIRQRVADPGLALYHPSEPAESRGFESVISALVLATWDRARGAREPDPSTEAAFRRMWQEQIRTGEAKGSWAWSRVGLEPWEADDSVYFGTALAAVAVGAAPGGYAARPGIREGVADMENYLRTRFLQQMPHHRLAALWASSRLPAVVGEADRQAALDGLWRSQNADGGWSLRALGPWKPRPKWYNREASESADSDGYATAFAACALRQGGIAPSTPGLVRALAWLERNQQPGGGWAARSLNGMFPDDPVLGKLMTDAAAGYAVLALAAR
jgi:squalene-hopene/tetraprenyl-beta-curcumene cyclase